MANSFGLSYNEGLGGTLDGMTNDAKIQAMYADIVGDLAVYFSNMTLLPNQQLIAMNYPIQGAVGNTVKIPVQQQFADATIVPEGNDIIPDHANNFETAPVMLEVAKRGAGTFITSEAVEDGGSAAVTNGVVNQLAQALAQATDKAGFQTLLTGAEGVLADSDAVNVETFSAAAVTGTADYCLVMSPQAAAYASKRAPSVNMDADINADGWVTTGTTRNGFAQVRPEWIAALESTAGVPTADMNVDAIAQAVAYLRANNAPTDASGFYVGVVNPAQEYAINKLLATNGSNGFIMDPSIIGNQALRDGSIGTLYGVKFYRSNNLPQGVTVA